MEEFLVLQDVLAPSASRAGSCLVASTPYRLSAGSRLEELGCSGAPENTVHNPRHVSRAEGESSARMQNRWCDSVLELNSSARHGLPHDAPHPGGLCESAELGRFNAAGFGRDSPETPP